MAARQFMQVLFLIRRYETNASEHGFMQIIGLTDYQHR